MSLLQTMQPTIKEISLRHQSLSQFVQKAQKQLPILRQKLQSAVPKDVAKIQEAVTLISDHINRNHSEAQDLSEVVQSLLIQAQDDGNGGSAVQALSQVLKQGQAVIDGLGNLQILIQGIQSLVESKKSEQMTSSITNQLQRPPQPTPKQNINNSNVSYIDKRKIDDLQNQLNEANYLLQAEIESSQKQQQLIEDIQIEVQTAQNKHRQEVNLLKNTNQALQKEITQLKQSKQTGQLVQNLQEEIIQYKEEIVLLRQENENLVLQAEDELKQLQQQFIEIQVLAAQPKSIIENKLSANLSNQVQLNISKPKAQKDIKDEKQQNVISASSRRVQCNDELSDPEDAAMTVQKSQLTVKSQLDIKQSHPQQTELQQLKQDKEDMQKLIDSLKLVLIKMSVNIDSPKIQQYLTKNHGVVLIPSTIDDLEASDREILHGSLRSSAMNTSLW
ncbi:hypothetical protein SS50377_25664 [Spironucleus salmonicida]|uniref:Uncharacterized protein n=2 Tax=Spironucleus salmonicida TaxID=348837 RepID=V6LXS3_9EUKA|nr:hypothetical protein SS50377_25664 [Spironucleus salmonicida]|eukprot:EST49437.1 Hypothetical protein SS50377_10184 [Spironucleus salmonicida]